MKKEIILIDLQTQEEISLNKALRMIIDNEVARQKDRLRPQDIDLEKHVMENVDYYLFLYDLIYKK